MMKSQIQTDIKISPAKSQTILFCLAIVAAACLLSGFYFLWYKHESSWIPIVIGLMLLAPVVAGWFKSQKDIDLDSAQPTNIVDERGNQLTIDNRALQSPQLIQNLEKIIYALSHREPLPSPDGLVDNKGVPVPDSKGSAQNIVKEINNKIQITTAQAVTAICLGASQDVAPRPLIEEPKSDLVIATNLGQKETK